MDWLLSLQQCQQASTWKIPRYILPHLLLLEASDDPLTGNPRGFVKLRRPLEVIVIGREDAAIELLPAENTNAYT